MDFATIGRARLTACLAAAFLLFAPSALLAADPAVEYAQPNHVFHADAAPNDPSFGSLGAMRDTGQGGAYAGDDVDATLAWDLSTGNPALKTGIVDSGVDCTHPDLAANFWTSPGEIPINFEDDDGGGYVDDVHGFDFVTGNGDSMDDYQHGTHGAGTSGSVGDNGIGVTGMLWHCRIVPIKFINHSGSGTESAAIAAGQLFVSSAGGSRWNIGAVHTNPQCHDSPHIVTVASTDGRDLMITFSCWGPTQVDLGAPGSLIYSCKPGGLYQNLDGTSMAAPHVSGAAALAWSLFPDATPQAIRATLLSAVDTIPPMTGKVWSNGRLNAHRTQLRCDRTPPGSVSDMLAEPVGEGVLRLRWSAPGDDGGRGGAAAYDLRLADAPMDSAAFLLAAPLAVPTPHAGGTPETLSVCGLATRRTYWFALRASDDFGHVGALSASFPFTPSLPGAGVAGELPALGLRLLGANPAPRGAAFELSLAREADADVAVFDLRGARVVTLARGRLAVGRHLLRWDGAGDGARGGAGVYFVRAACGGESVTRRLVVLGH